MDMMPPIWPWARRFIQTKKPMISSIGSMNGMSWAEEADGRRGELDRDVVLLHRGEQLRRHLGRAGGGELLAAGAGAGDLLVDVVPHDLVDVALLDLLGELGERDRSSGCWDSDRALIAVRPSTATSTHTNQDGSPFPPFRPGGPCRRTRGWRFVLLGGHRHSLEGLGDGSPRRDRLSENTDSQHVPRRSDPVRPSVGIGPGIPCVGHGPPVRSAP